MNELDQKILNASLPLTAIITNPSRENIEKALAGLTQLWKDLSASVVQNRMDTGSFNDVLAMVEQGELFKSMVMNLTETLQNNNMYEELVGFAKEILDHVKFNEPSELEFKHALKKATLLAIDECQGTSAAAEFFKTWRKEEPGSGYASGSWITLLKKHEQYEDAHDFAALAIEKITGELPDDEFFIDAFQELSEEEGNMYAFDVIQEQWMELQTELENRTQYYGLVQSMIKNDRPDGIRDVYDELVDDVGDRSEAHHLVEMMVQYLKDQDDFSEEGVLDLMEKYLEGDDSFLNE